MCDKIISDDPFSLRYVPDQYKTQVMWDKAVQDCLAALKFVSAWFVTGKIIKKLFTTLYADEKIYSVLMKILVILYLILMKWVFLI